MSRNSKKKRDARKIKSKRQLNKLKENRSGNNSILSPIPLKPFSNPFAQLTEEQRKDIFSKVSSDSKKKVSELLDSIESTLRKYDPTIILSIIAGYSLTAGAGDNGVQYTESLDRPSQANIELLQAISLKIPRNEIGLIPPTPEIIQKIWNELKGVGQAFTLSRMTPDNFKSSEAEQAITMVQEFIRGHTQNVRNWGYHSQVLNICTELYSYFDSAIYEKFGFSATSVICTFKALIERLELGFTERLTLLRDLRAIKDQKRMVRKYYEIIGQDVEQAECFIVNMRVDSIPRKRLFMLLMSHYDIRMAELFRINQDDLAREAGLEKQTVEAILSRFSMSYGDLSDCKREFFFFENPICRRPIISDKDGYYCMAPQVFFSFIIEIFDEIVGAIDKVALHERRSLYLERKIEEIVKRRFPESQVVSGVTWIVDDNKYETDLIAFIDSHAIIFEAKSQKISRPALRGAPDRIKRHLQEIFIEPSIQSARLEEKLNELRQKEGLADSLLEQLPVDINAIKNIVRVSVSLEDFATLQTNFKLFKSTGWVPEKFKPCPCMNLADLETVFDFLEHPVQIIHYLARRKELEGKYKIMGDELDLLGLYRSNLFNMEYTVGDAESELMISGLSKPIDIYYMSLDQGILTKKPSPKISHLFKSIFKKLEERAVPRWTEIGCILNRFPYEAQVALSKKINELSGMVNLQWQDESHKNIIIFNPPQLAEYALAVVLFKNQNKERRREFIDHAAALALEAEDVNYALVISFNLDCEDQVYNSIGLFEGKK